MRAALFATREVTEDGLERTFATNHHGLFRADPRAARPADRGGAGAHRQHRLRCPCARAARLLRPADGRGATDSVSPMAARSCATFCSRASSRAGSPALASRRTRCIRDSSPPGSASATIASSPCWCAPPCGCAPSRGERGAETIVYLASAPEAAAISGQYFVQCRPASPSRAAQNNDGCAPPMGRERAAYGIDIDHAASPRAIAAAERIAAILAR